MRDEIVSMEENDKCTCLIRIAEIINELHSKNLYLIDLRMSNIYFDLETHKIRIKYFSSFKKDYLNSKFLRKYTAENDDKICYECPDVYDVPLLEDAITLNQRRSIWALGCLISETMSLIIPWHQQYINKLHIESSLGDKVPFPIPDIILEKHCKYQDIIEKCTEIDGEQRIQIDQVHQILLDLSKQN